MITTLAQSIASHLQSILVVNDADDGAINVSVDYVPDYTLADIAEAKVIIVPVKIDWGNLTRGKVRSIYEFEIGVLQRLGQESDIGDMIDKVELIGSSLLNYSTGDAKCMVVETVQLYDPQDYKTSKKIISVLKAIFKDY